MIVNIISLLRQFMSLFKNDTKVSQSDTIKVYMITKQEILMGRDEQYPNDYTQEISDNIDKLLISLNKFREIYGKPMKVTSGWRPPSVNSNTVGAAKTSKHMLGLACDFSDKDKALSVYCLNNLEVLEKCGLYLEDPSVTFNWVHLQCVPPKSGKRVFKP